MSLKEFVFYSDDFTQKVDELIQNTRAYESIGRNVAEFTKAGNNSVMARMSRCEKRDQELGKWFEDNGYTTEDIKEYAKQELKGNI